MDKTQFLEGVKAVKGSSKRNFKQSYELIINLKGLDMKKPDQHVDFFMKLPHGKGKPVKIAALVGPELAEQAKETCDTVILQDDFAKYTAKKDMKKLAGDHDYFIAQANIMPDVAKTFGRVFGPRGKMPNPKAGCVVPPNANLATVTEDLKQTIKVQAKIQPSIKVMVGTEDMTDDQIAENSNAVYANTLGKLPQETNNIKSVLLKLTMSPPVKITDKGIEKKETTEPPKTEQPKKEKTEETAPDTEAAA